ncbi:MAG: F0F1 ATP synthase subunit delta [Hyphomicrobiales bacterium]|nr:F0F1 ATP synthase subunit delta [Rickettsiales bacterium]MCP5361274.1 F0F1 ATP synthase subunit delta [Hyphomicrobiales bacterium]
MAGRHTGKKSLARRYARALFALAQDAKKLETIESDLAIFSKLLQEAVPLNRLITDPTLSRKIQADALETILKKAGADALTIRFFDVLSENRRLALTGECIRAFNELLSESRGEVEATVTTPFALNKKLSDELKKALEKSTGKKVVLNEKQDTSLLGGLSVRIGSRLLDNSLSGKLERIRLLQKQANE